MGLSLRTELGPLWRLELVSDRVVTLLHGSRWPVTASWWSKGILNGSSNCRAGVHPALRGHTIGV